MKALLAILRRPRVWRIVVLPNLGFAVVAWATDAQPLITVLNLVVVALSVNVCIAFAPNVFSALAKPAPLDKADIISFGIFTSWGALVLRTMWSLAWRYLGEPGWLVNTDFNSYFIFLAACGAVLHLASPGSLKESIPPARWIKIGAWVASAVFLALLLLSASDIRRGLHHIATPHDEGGGRER